MYGQEMLDYWPSEEKDAIRKAIRATTALERLQGGYAQLCYGEYVELKSDGRIWVIKTKDDNASLLFWHRNLEAVELGALYIRREARGNGVLNKVFADLFKACDWKQVIVVGEADRFEIAEEDVEKSFSKEFWASPHTNFRECRMPDADSNDSWLNRLITQYGFTQPRMDVNEYFVKRVPQ